MILMPTKRIIAAMATVCLTLAVAPVIAQQGPQGQSPHGTGAGPQRPSPAAIPEKFGRPIDVEKPISPEEQTGDGNLGGAQPPHSRGLDLQAPAAAPKTLSEPATRPQSQ
jgi:hypothetical protein